jgi:tetratricopeptide (TPR) repeat protein
MLSTTLIKNSLRRLQLRSESGLSWSGCQQQQQEQQHHHQAESLLRIGAELFLKGILPHHFDEALAIFETAHSVISAAALSSPPESLTHSNSNISMVLTGTQLEVGRTLLLKHGDLSGKFRSSASLMDREYPQLEVIINSHHYQGASAAITLPPPDLYLEDGCDVGPRMLKMPVVPSSSLAINSIHNLALLEAMVLFNKALVFHTKGILHEARNLYELASFAVQGLLGLLATPGALHEAQSIVFMELAMRVHNNLGLIHYMDRREGLAAASFETAVHFAKPFAEQHNDPDQANIIYNLEYVTTLSNWCRALWMRGDMRSEHTYMCLKEVLHVRFTSLPWDHPDVAAAYFNLAMAEYARRETHQAAAHLRQYLTIQAYRDKEKHVRDLDIMPALIVLLLIGHEDKEDHASQELVRGLRTLQDKRQDEGPDSPEVASVLNFVGTLLFHQQDYENALLFFIEELRLEDKPKCFLTAATQASETDTDSVSVTCNNIGRILQELGRHHEAIRFYERTLESEYGDIRELMPSSALLPAALESKADFLRKKSSASVNLYSTVWYNLGLIHDKLGSYDKAICAFEMSLELRQTMLGPDHPDIACLLYNIGVLHMEQRHLDEASETFCKALRIRRTGATGQLSDKHIVKTLEKLVSLHKAKGNIHKALEASLEILTVQQQSSDIDAISRIKQIGITMRSIAELYHANNDLRSAICTGTESVETLRVVAEAGLLQHRNSHSIVDMKLKGLLLMDRIANMEQYVSSLLLLGSLHHELCEPLRAAAILQEAAAVVRSVKAATYECPLVTAPSSMYALQEVTAMLSCLHCAPQA